MRYLKRYLARHVYPILLKDAAALTQECQRRRILLVSTRWRYGLACDPRHTVQRAGGRAMTGEQSSMAPLRVPMFRTLWIASIIFSLGHLVQVVTSSWLILEMTGSPLWVSAMIGAPTMPLLVLSLPAGAAADLFNRRIILLVATSMLVAASVAMSVLSTLDALTPSRLVGLGLVIGTGIAFFNPAWHALVPSLVPAALVPGAVSLNSASGGVATALGPAVGGLMLATVGAGFSFGVAAVGYLAIAIAISFARTGDLDQEKGSLVVAVAAGIRYLRFSRGYLWLLLLGSLFGFASASLRSMLPNLTSDSLGGGSVMYGVLLGMFGCGAMVGGVTRSLASGWLGHRLVPICIVVFGLAGVVIGLSTLVVVTAVLVTIAGLVWTWILATLNSTYQVLTPDWVRGRTMSAFTLSVFGFVPMGSLAAGALGDSVGAGTALLIFSVAVVTIGMLSFRMPIPVLEQIESPVVAEPEEETIPTVEQPLEPALVITTWHVDPPNLEAFLEVLSDLRRVRLRTGATHWTAYRDTIDLTSISEVFILPTWEQRVQQVKRLDTVAMQVIRRADELGSVDTRVRRNLVSFDVDSELKGRDRTFEVLEYPSSGLFRSRRRYFFAGSRSNLELEREHGDHSSR